MVFYSSSIFKGSNIFHLTERASAITAITGNVFALIGALGDNKKIETLLGVLFTTSNIVFAGGLLYSFNRDVGKAVVVPIIVVLSVEDSEIEQGSAKSRSDNTTRVASVAVSRNIVSIREGMS